MKTKKVLTSVKWLTMIFLNYIWGLNGFIWSQFVADSINAVTAFLIYTRVDGKIREQMLSV